MMLVHVHLEHLDHQDQLGHQDQLEQMVYLALKECMVREEDEEKRGAQVTWDGQEREENKDYLDAQEIQDFQDHQVHRDHKDHQGLQGPLVLQDSSIRNI
jgi:hypothetical protein